MASVFVQCIGYFCFLVTSVNQINSDWSELQFIHLKYSSLVFNPSEYMLV